MVNVYQLRRMFMCAKLYSLHPRISVFFFESRTFSNFTIFYTKIAIYVRLKWYIIELHVKTNLVILINFINAITFFRKLVKVNTFNLRHVLTYNYLRTKGVCVMHTTCMNRSGYVSIILHGGERK
jgi:hypothetical protein